MVLERERHPIRAGIASIGGYSAHADQQGLVNFVTRMRNWPSEVRVVHGDTEAKRALARRLQAVYDEKNKPLRVVIPN